MEKCISDSLLLQFLANEVDAETSELVKTHVEQCASCQKKIEKHSEDQDLKQWQQSYQRQQNDESSKYDPHSEDRINRIINSTISSIHQINSQLTNDSNLSAQNSSILIGQESAQDSARIVGHYQLIKKIGQGGMGVVFQAVHTRLKKRVVLKILLNKEWDNSNQTQRFYREMELVGQLDHPNIVKATDAGEADDICYLAMESLEGHDLKTILKSEGALPITAACTIVRQVANGLQYIHNHNLIHRDIKPSNLFLTNDGQVKILDLGLAGLRYSVASNEDITHSDCIMGSVNYMAPEQAQSIKHIDHRSDIYSLGCTFYQLLTNQVIFKRETPVETIIAHREAPVPLLASQIPDVPEELENLFQAMVKKQPDDRIQSMSEIVKTIDQFLAKQNNMQINDETDTQMTDTQELRQICHNVELTQPVGVQNHDISTQYMPTQNILKSKKVLLSISTASVLLVGFLIYSQFFREAPEDPISTSGNDSSQIMHSQALQEREVAIWALKQGCTIAVQIPNGKEILNIAQQELLPGEDFYITQIEFPESSNLTYKFLAPLEKLKKIETLLLSDCQIQDDALVAIKNLTTLHKLDLHDTDITDKGLSHIKELKNLTHLSLQKNLQITDEGLQVLNQFHKLVSVNLARLNISDKGIIFLKKNPKLIWFNISDTQVTDESVKDLKKLKRLEELYLDGTKISKKGINEIKAAFKNSDPIRHN